MIYAILILTFAWGFLAGHFFGFTTGHERGVKQAELAETLNLPHRVVLYEEGKPAPSETD